jgi:hypothetical protein
MSSETAQKQAVKPDLAQSALENVPPAPRITIHLAAGASVNLYLSAPPCRSGC